MSEKTRQFRSLLLEPLECRSVFSVDGLAVWHFSQSSLSFDFDAFRPAQYPHSDATSTGNDSRPGSSQGFGNSHEFNGVKYFDRRSTRGSVDFGSSLHRGRFVDAPLPPAESEGPSVGAPPTAVGSKPVLDVKLGLDLKPGQASKQGLDLKPTLDTQLPQTTTQSGTTTIIIVFNPAPAEVTQSHENPLANTPSISQFVSRGSERTNIVPTGNTVGNSLQERLPASVSQNSASSLSQNVPAPVTSDATQVHLSSSPVLSTIASGTTTFDFSSRVTSGIERSKTDGLGRQGTSDFRLSRPLPVPTEVVDQALVERASGWESLEKLLPGLAENHHRNRTQNVLDVNQPSSPDQSWRPETAKSVEIAFADGGMIALALNRDIAMNELEELSEDAGSEHKAWIANVGIFRAFENGAVAATEYAVLTNRMTRTADSNSSTRELLEVESEVANSQFHPLLASTSAALGVVMLGLRRMRGKTIPLMFTSRKR